MKTSKENQKDTDDAFNDQNIEKSVEIFSTDDERLKIIGEILSNQTSRTILKLLILHELPTHEIIQQTGFSLSLILHHVNKMLDVKLVKISKISKSSKGQDMKYYKAKQGIIILPQIPSQKAKSSKLFQKSLKRILRFCSIGIVGIASWFVTQSVQTIHIRPTPPPSQIPSEIILGDLFWPVVISLIVIIIGLITERVFTAVKK